MELEKELNISSKEFKERLKKLLGDWEEVDNILFRRYFVDNLPDTENVSLGDIDKSFKKTAIKVYEGRGWFRNKEVPKYLNSLRGRASFFRARYSSLPRILLAIEYYELKKPMQEIVDKELSREKDIKDNSLFYELT